jgi:hypothetical protein
VYEVVFFLVEDLLGGGGIVRVANLAIVAARCKKQRRSGLPMMGEVDGYLPTEARKER